MGKFDQDTAVKILNQILEAELAGAVRYMHYSLMVFGYNRIPIVSWLRGQSAESMDHAREAGELITHFGGHPSLGIGDLLESHKHDIGDILQESLKHEKQGLALYQDLLAISADRSVMVEEYARRMIAIEELHIGEVDKMLRKPGAIERFEG